MASVSTSLADAPANTMVLMGVFLLTCAVIGVVMAIMAVGLLFNYPCLRGSCGGPEVVGSDGATLSCETCPNRPGRRAST